jgi:hypothetical protein
VDAIDPTRERGGEADVGEEIFVQFVLARGDGAEVP